MTDNTAGPTADAPESAQSNDVDPDVGVSRSRRWFKRITILLALLLVALIIYLLFFLSPSGLTSSGGDVRDGLKPLLVIRGPGVGDQPEFDRPLGAALAPNGDIYVSDTGNNRIVVFDDSGGFIREFGGFGIAKPLPGGTATWEEGKLNSPLGIDVDVDGTVYVADFQNDSISVFDADGNFLRRFPDPGERVGQGGSGQGGTGIAVKDVAVSDGLVYATDQYQVVVFTVDGEFVGQFGRPGSSEGSLDHPNGIEIGRDGTVYVADSNNSRVTAYTPEGESVLWTAGEPVTELTLAQEEYTFGLPRGIALLGDDTLIVADSFDFDLVRVSNDGSVMGRFGSRGTEPAEFNFPNGVDADGSVIVVADKENDRVQLVELVVE